MNIGIVEKPTNANAAPDRQSLLHQLLLKQEASPESEKALPVHKQLLLQRTYSNLLLLLQVHLPLLLLLLPR